MSPRICNMSEASSKASSRASSETPSVPEVRYFRGLPRELRDHIFRYLLCLPNGITIQQPAPHRAAKCQDPLYLSVLRTNKQTYNEAIQILFGENTLCLNLSLLSAVEWLKESVSRPEAIEALKTIRLGTETMGQYVGPEDYHIYISRELSNKLSEEIGYRGKLRTVEIEVPENDTRGVLFMPTRYCWRVAKELVELFMAGSSLKEMRIVYPTFLDSSIDFENLNAIKHLRAAEDRFESETRERRIKKAWENGHRTDFATREEMEAFVRSQRRRHEFRVSLAAPREVETGTILVLAKPKKVEQSRVA
ncbi:hypothetical protein K402DRAFT_416457 [Aulographum hederae CBS 113979]|uniref:F-box domain-containing protein n=1 Tax=Aulographum hederae CBS 113979 TaxID=1176131 RepID=A0A6G1HG06_9PEZI|nr:hypothetical protein K402DRAFT_416457 [Aulographum hederae CBS 113979]